MTKSRVEIEYCQQCNFLLRAGWMAQELLQTFAEEIGELALIPGSGGHFIVRVEGEPIFSRRALGRFPDAKELKLLLRDRIGSHKVLGHAERSPPGS
jgi:selenoprotein W-related protein